MRMTLNHKRVMVRWSLETHHHKGLQTTMELVHLSTRVKKANLVDPSTNNSAVEEATSQASDANIQSCQDLMYSTDIIQEMVELASKLNPNGTFDQKGSEIVEGQTSKWVSEESSKVPLPHPKSLITALDSATMEAMFDSNSSVINDQSEAA